jgi:hypothetical protein
MDEKRTCGNCLYGKKVEKSKVIVCATSTTLETRWNTDMACEKWRKLKRKFFGKG